jgi:hypothetical protein
MKNKIRLSDKSCGGHINFSAVYFSKYENNEINEETLVVVRQQQCYRYLLHQEQQ